MLPPFSCENVHLQRSWGKGKTGCVGGEGAPRGLAAALLAAPLGRDPWDCPMMDLGMLGKGAKLTEGLGRLHGVQW